MSADHSTNPFETELDRTPANFTPLTPLTFIERAATVYPDHPSVIDGERRFTWVETYARCRRLASALSRRGVGPGDCVAVFAPNVRAIYEASFGVPMLGAVLNTINIRLDAAAVAFILEHGEAKVLLTDREFSPVVSDALSRMDAPPLVVDIDDPLAEGGERIGEVEYEAFLEEGDPWFEWSKPRRRVAGDLAQLHVGHHGESEGGRLPPPRRVPQRDVEHRRLEPRAPPRLPVDAADVPLQRVVLPVVAGRRRRDERVHAQGGGRRHLPGHRRGGRDPHVRRAGGAGADPERERRGAAAVLTPRARDDRGGAPRPPRCWNAWSAKGSR